MAYARRHSTRPGRLRRPAPAERRTGHRPPLRPGRCPRRGRLHRQGHPRPLPGIRAARPRLLGRRPGPGEVMTEDEWLTCTDLLAMLVFLRGRAGARKLRLFATACCGRVRDLFADEADRAALAA